jgi:hypothetical protein
MAQHSSRGILPLNPLRNDCVRPAERGVVRARMDGLGSKVCWLLIFVGRVQPAPQGLDARVSPALHGCPQLFLVFDLANSVCSKNDQATRSRNPVRRPSGGAVERGVWQDAKRGMLGQGWPVLPTLGAAPERGKLSSAKPGCRARFLFGYFLFCASKEKVTRRGAK